jgi:hypothetical protein
MDDERGQIEFDKRVRLKTLNDSIVMPFKQQDQSILSKFPVKRARAGVDRAQARNSSENHCLW